MAGKEFLSLVSSSMILDIPNFYGEWKLIITIIIRNSYQISPETTPSSFSIMDLDSSLLDFYDSTFEG